MKISVIEYVISLINLPKVHWVIFDCDRTKAMFSSLPCGCRHIYLDAINLSDKECSYFTKFLSIVHETFHWLFSKLPESVNYLLDDCLDITHGNAPELIYGIVREETMVIYLFEN